MNLQYVEKKIGINIMKKIIQMQKYFPESYKTFIYLSNLQNEIKESLEDTIILDFRETKYIHAMFTSFIGALCIWAECYGKHIVYRMKTGTRLYKYIIDSGLYDYVNSREYSSNNQNSIPFRTIQMDDESIIEYTNSILAHTPVQLTPTADEALFKNIYELFNNALVHSEAQNGIYGCGHWLPKKKELVFSVYDTGIGIPTSIQKKLNTNISSKEAIEWAFLPINSTMQLIDNIPRGVGLSSFLKFIRLNNGFLSIVSNDICYIYNNSEKYHYLDHPIEGTIVSFIIRSDSEHIYDIKSS